MSDFTLGKHDQAISQLVSDMESVKRDVAEIKTLLAVSSAERAAQRKAAALAGTVAGAVFSFLLKFGTWLYARVNG